ncbi:hypothetical protein F4679DRAFT_218667 [Xylaria curta]|nr:hypothetical protein F4679DRAFT_218667 [Xylaria curta]
MKLADPAIVAIVALLVMCIPGIRWLSRNIRRKLRSQRKSLNMNTVLPLSGRSFDPLDGACMDPCVGLHAPGGMIRQAAYAWVPPSPIVSSSQGFVAISLSAAVIWPAVDLPSRRSGRQISLV